MSIYGERRPVYARRFQNDLLELFSHNFNCSSSNLTVTMGESDNVAHIIIHICVFEGPYRNGHFSFYFNIPGNYSILYSYLFILIHSLQTTIRLNLLKYMRDIQYIIQI